MDLRDAVMVGRGRGRVLGKARAAGLTLFGLEANRRD